MRPFTRLFNWYFGRDALPYWCIVILDLVLCLLGAMLMLLLRHPLAHLVECRFELLHTLGVLALFNLIGFRIFHTYSGIIRYSQFVDLIRVAYASATSLVLALVFNELISVSKLDNVFYPLTGRMTIAIYIFTLLLMIAVRIVTKTLFERAMVSTTASNALIFGTHAGASPSSFSSKATSVKARSTIPTDSWANASTPSTKTSPKSYAASTSRLSSSAPSSTARS